ncbi:MAG: hypothetical protein ABN502_05430 [Gammaproteobacteria bacterium]|jgi:hypothetical protein|uniref:Uncharacterized protein n=1 Tax=Xanthomonas boreopolis TaxID=86183 RepID=A0A919KIL0_9XANT|nr:hypothetical protein GCM10009090_29000 [[Pseudomonas] boreopolis]
MRLLASMLYCLMGLFGCHQESGTTSITRSTVDGRDLLFSKVESHAGNAVFHCLASSSGHCHYLVYEAACSATATAAADCPRRELDRFELAVGQVRELRGLAEDFRQCASATAIVGGC